MTIDQTRVSFFDTAYCILRPNVSYLPPNIATLYHIIVTFILYELLIVSCNVHMQKARVALGAFVE